MKALSLKVTTIQTTYLMLSEAQDGGEPGAILGGDTMIKLKWIRTCQECGLVQETPKPNPADKQEKWRDRKCKQCKSEALDYGKEYMEENHERA